MSAKSADTSVPLTPMQQMTIANLRRGQEGKVPVTITAEARADRLLAARERLDQGAPAKVTITVLLARVLARTLAEHPGLNAALAEDAIVRYADVNLGIAVTTDGGDLLVPVLPRAQERNVAELAAAIAELTARARARDLRPDDVRGGTFTLSSIGMVRLPIHATPLLVPRQSGILLAARATERPVVEEGDLGVGLVMPLSLTFDHVVVNGIPAVRFLEDLVARIERPDEWLD